MGSRRLTPRSNHYSIDRNEIVLHGYMKFSFLLNPVLITSGAVRIIGIDYTS